MGWLSNLINKAKKKTEETVNGVQNAAQQAVQNVASGYGDWLAQGQQSAQNAAQNVVAQGEQYVQGVMQEGQQAVQNAAQTGEQYAQGVMQQGQQAAQNAAQQGQQYVQGAVQQGQQVVGQVADNVQNKVQGAAQVVQNTAQGVTDRVNTVNDKIQGNTPAVAPAVTPAQTPTQTTAPTTTPTQTQPEAQAPASSFDADAPIMTYEDYLKQSEQGLGYIKDKVTQQIDQQNTETLKHIDEALATGNKHAEDVKSTTDAAIEAQKQADTAYAESQRDLMINTSQAERDEVYKYAEETLAGALGYNNEAYGKLVEAITGQMEAGKLAASEAKNLLMIMAEEAKNTTYGAAERQREEAERQADINRQRAIADANSAYEQNKASYGAKAEALGNMGLTAGGYGDWLNASAYAQNRGEVQGARAQSDNAKREAKYTEDMTKLQADQEYNDKKYKAESEYQNKLYDIDTSYRANLSEAEQSKMAADKAAQDAERETKQSADSKHRENVYNAESTYGDWLNKAESAEREGKLQNDITYKEMLYGNEQSAKDQKLEASQKAENAKLDAEISYVEGILDNSKALAEYKQSLEEGTKAAEEKKLAVYEQLLRGVNDGTYTAEDAAALADAFGLGTKWKDAIANSAENKSEADASAKAEIDTEQKTSIYTGMLDSVNNGAYTAEQISYLADRYGLSAEDKQSLIAAAEKYASENAAQGAEDKATQATKSFVGLLESANAGQLTADELQQIATEFGLSDAQKDLLAKAAERYSGKVTEAETQADAEYKNGVYTELLNAANAGGYTAEQVKDLAARFGLNETEQNQLANAAQSYADKVDKAEGKAESEATRDTYTKLLGSANSGAYTAEQIGRLADEYGLTAEQKASLVSAANEYKSNYDDAVNSDTETQQKKTYVDLLSGVYSGAYDKDLVADLADEFGLSDKQKQSLIDAAGRYADDMAAGKSEADTEYKRGVYTELLDIANRGGYNADQIGLLADEYGLSDKQKQSLIGAAQGYTDRVGDEKAQIEAETKLNVYTSLLDAANMGGYTAEQIVNLATRYGLDETQTEELRAAAKEYSDKYSDAVAKDEAAQKNMQFINLLGSANLGELTKDELENVATALGLDDAQKSLLAKAAERYTSASEEDKATQKSMNFVSLLDGANTGAYNAAQIEEIAKQFGFDAAKDKALINMLKTAANDFASGEAGKTAKEDMQYQNAIYSELLAAANNGDYTEEQAKDLAARFGLDTKAQNLVGDAARIAAENAEQQTSDTINSESASNALQIKNTLTGDTTDEYIDDYVDAGYITETDAEKLKEDRNAVAKTEINDLVKSGNYAGAIDRAEEFKELGYIDNDTYQTAYFEAEKNNAMQVKTADDIDDYTADLKNMLNSGKISQKDYNSLLSYMYKNAGSKLNSSAYSYTKYTSSSSYGATYTIQVGDAKHNTGEYDLLLNVADTDTAAVLDNISGGKSEGTLVMFGDTLYVCNGKVWGVVPDRNGLYEEYNKLLARQEKPTAPKHQAGSSTNGGYANPGAAAHGR